MISEYYRGCEECGEAILPGAKAVRVENGKKTTGEYHEVCFTRIFGYSCWFAPVETTGCSGRGRGKEAFFCPLEGTEVPRFCPSCVTVRFMSGDTEIRQFRLHDYTCLLALRRRVEQKLASAAPVPEHQELVRRGVLLQKKEELGTRVIRVRSASRATCENEALEVLTRLRRIQSAS